MTRADIDQARHEHSVAPLYVVPDACPLMNIRMDPWVDGGQPAAAGERAGSRLDRASPACHRPGRYGRVIEGALAVIKNEDFLTLAREGFREVFEHYGLTESGVDLAAPYAQLTAVNNSRYLTVGLDRAQDYRIYAKVGKVGPNRRPLPGVVQLSSARDVTAFDLDFIVSQRRGGQAVADRLGRYGAGRPDDVRSAIREVADAVMHDGAPVLSSDDEWDRLSSVILSRMNRRG